MHNIQQQDLKDMFTFREKGQQIQRSIHSHRLLYLHSTENDKNTLENIKKFKTQPSDRNQSTRSSAYYTNNKADSSKTCRYASQRKIKYFDLDLKSLVQSTIANSEIKSERSSQRQTLETVKYLNKSLRGKESSSKKSMISNSSEKSSIETTIKTCNNNGHNNKNKSSQVFKEIENLLQKDYITEIRNQQTVRDFKKAKAIAQNNKEFKQKYTKMKMNHYQPYQKLFSSNYLKQKPKKQKQNQSDLQVKRVQRVLVDKNGNQYKVTIQKLL